MWVGLAATALAVALGAARAPVDGKLQTIAFLAGALHVQIAATILSRPGP